MKRLLIFLLLLWCTPAFGVGTFAYTKSTNKIVVTDGTSGAPATFNDMYTADQAGTVTLLAAWAPNSGTKALTYQLTPALAKGLKIDFTVASKTAEADYIFITGTDIDGGAQTESIDVTAGNGTYTTTKWFATITNIDCSDNAAGGGTVWADGTVAVVQNQWGVVREIVADAQYNIDCHVDFGDGATATYFTSLNEMIYFADGMLPVLKNSATLQSGELAGDWGINGSYWRLKLTGLSSIVGYAGTGYLYLYSSRIHFDNNSDYGCNIAGGYIDIRNSTISSIDKNGGYLYFGAAIQSLVVQKLYMINSLGLNLARTPDTIEDVHLHNTAYGLFFQDAPASAGNVYFTNNDLDIVTITSDGTLIDSSLPTGITLAVNSDTVISKFSCNVHVADEDGVDLASVVVDCEYAHLVQGSDGKTYKCILNHTAVDATHKPITGTDWATYWELYSATGGYGDWNTGFAYKSGTAEWTAGTVTTASTGSITEQNIQYKKWTTTSELEEARIHKFTLTYGGDTYVIQDYIVDHPIVWHLEFPPQVTLLNEVIDRLKRIGPYP